MSPADLGEMEEFDEANISAQDGVRMDWIHVGEALTADMGGRGEGCGNAG